MLVAKSIFFIFDTKLPRARIARITLHRRLQPRLRALLLLHRGESSCFHKSHGFLLPRIIPNSWLVAHANCRARPHIIISGLRSGAAEIKFDFGPRIYHHVYINAVVMYRYPSSSPTHALLHGFRILLRISLQNEAESRQK